MGLQLGGLLFAMTCFAVLVAKTRSPLFAVLAAMVLPVLVALFGTFVYLQQSSRITGVSVRAHVAQAVRHRRVRHQLVQVSRLALAVLSIAFYVWYPFFVLSRADRFGGEPWRVVVGVTASVLVFGGAWIVLGRLARRARIELARWQEIEASFE